MPLNNSHIDIVEQRRLTKKHGEHVQLYRAMLCSCKIDGEENDPNCRVCRGTGRVYQTPIAVKGIITEISSQDKALVQSGQVMPGDLIFTPDVKVRIPIHDLDVIRLRYGLPYEGDVIKRGADRLAYLPARIDTIEQHDSATGNRTAYASTAYTLQGKKIVWEVGQGPAAGSYYSVKYSAIYDWVVHAAVTMERVIRKAHLGQRVAMRKRHLAQIEVWIVP